MSQPLIKFIYFLPRLCIRSLVIILHKWHAEKLRRAINVCFNIRKCFDVTFQCNAAYQRNRMNVRFHQYHDASLISVNTNQIRKYRIANNNQISTFTRYKIKLNIIYIIYMNLLLKKLIKFSVLQSPSI